jgi:HSP20 family protein
MYLVSNFVKSSIRLKPLRKKSRKSLNFLKKLNRSESGKNFHIIERSSGSFVRNIELPAHLIQEDKIEASFKNGVLLIRIPKSDHVLQEAKKIPISTS